MRKMKLVVRLNGTDHNPYYNMDLIGNPFPQIPSHEYQANCLHLSKLGADPIPDVEYIREHLKGYTQEFVDLCCNKFVKGSYISFVVEWSY
jgi:hypothetical protein